MRALTPLICVATLSCGARSELEQPPPPPLCSHGDPPVLLADVAVTHGGYDGDVTTDGANVYVSWASAPLLWKVDVHGGPVVPLYGQGTAPGAGDPGPGAPRLFAGGGGVYFDAFAAQPPSLDWVSASGGAPKVITGSRAAAFDWQRARAFVVAGSGAASTESILAVSLIDGSSQPFATTKPGDGLRSVMATSRFLHLLLAGSGASPSLDRRIDMESGADVDEIALGGDVAQWRAGPAALCYASDGAIACLDDDASTPQAIASGLDFHAYEPLPDVDAEWVYASISGSDARLSRFSLADAHEERLMNGGTIAATSGAGCVFVASWKERASNSPASWEIWRVSP